MRACVTSPLRVFPAALAAVVLRIRTETYGRAASVVWSESGGQLTPAESVFARELAQRGFHVRLVPQQRGKRTPDFSVNGVTMELKTLTAFGKSTLMRRLEDATGQNPNIIIINCRNVPANRASVDQQIRSAERKLGRGLQGRVIVWMPDGSVHAH